MTTDPVLIHQFLETSSRLYPDQIALVHEKVRVTYRELNQAADRLCAWIRLQGTAGGDRVALMMENSFAYVVSYYAALKAGMVVAPLSYELKPDGLRNLLADLQPTLFIFSARCERVVKRTDLVGLPIQSLVISNPRLNWDDCWLPVHQWEDIQDQADYRHNPENPLQDSDPASIVYTSGSTGIPKGVMLTHANVVANTRSICEYLQLTPDDIQMVVLPFFYVMGKSLLNTHVAVGGTVVINNKFAFPASVIQQMVAEKVTGFSGVPSTYAYLLHRSPLAAQKDRLKSLRYCSQAGGHMSGVLKKKLREALPETTDIYIMYGATEAAARLTFLDPRFFEEKIESIGKPIPGVTLRILDSEGTAVPKGQIGELTARGDNIMAGYWNDPEATRAVLDDAGYHTGDLAWQDEDGFYFLAGRKDNLLKVGGHRINPQEIEDCLAESGLVLEAAVIGAADELLGNRLIAFAAALDETVTETQLMRICESRLPRYKLPSAIHFLPALPKKANGKIDTKKLAVWIGD